MSAHDDSEVCGTCGTCAFWRRSEFAAMLQREHSRPPQPPVDWGKCHESSPAYDPASNRSGWPTTEATNWCGKFYPRAAF